MFKPTTLKIATVIYTMEKVKLYNNLKKSQTMKYYEKN